jgi:hypothetical protein
MGNRKLLQSRAARRTFLPPSKVEIRSKDGKLVKVHEFEDSRIAFCRHFNGYAVKRDFVALPAEVSAHAER